MQTSAVLREERERAGLTQAQLARKCGTSESSLRCYELGVRPIPIDITARAAKVLKSPRLAMTACQECPVNILVPPWLDRVDRHPVSELAVILAEAREAIGALENLSLVNKLRPGDLSPDERRTLERAMDQVADLIPAAAMALAAWCEAYGIDMVAVRHRQLAKFRARGYITEEDEEASA
ncbi:MAG: helix-turn-helix transcriptional regulator [Firmicutes bacterium]|nr:helix-turn-helix transcriptional regulator [Bacillota bacterium]